MQNEEFSLKTVGIICEYNPLHAGHRHQMQEIRRQFGEDTAIVCLMSGNYVQRGSPAIFDKSLRAQAALRSGADLVLEMPIGTTLSSAEGFASGSVAILARCCDTLCFGTESMDRDTLLSMARALLSPDFSAALKDALSSGCSFPAARAAALAQLGFPRLSLPNDTLACEYCKAILAQDAPLEILPIHRSGSYHAQEIDAAAPSATALRQAILTDAPWLASVPPQAQPIFAQASRHTLAAGERAVLARLRTMEEAEFEALPYGSEGLWRKFQKACRTESTIEAIASAVKSKRYTRTRIDRMLLCAVLGISREMLEAPAPYVRVLGFTPKGQTVLRSSREALPYLNAGAKADGAYWALEQRCGNWYGLFCTERIEPPCPEEKRRVVVCRPEEMQ